MNFQQTLRDKLVAQMEQHGTYLEPTDFKFGGHTVQTLDSGRVAELTVYPPQGGSFTLTYPLVNLVWVQSALVRTDGIVDSPYGFDVQTLVEQINLHLEPEHKLDAQMLTLTVIESPVRSYRLEPKPDAFAPAYYGVLELTAIDPRQNELALLTLLTGQPLLVRDVAKMLQDSRACGAVFNSTGVTVEGQLSGAGLVVYAVDQPDSTVTAPPSDVMVTLDGVNDSCSNARQLTLEVDAPAFVRVTFTDPNDSTDVKAESLIPVKAAVPTTALIYDVPANAKLWANVESENSATLRLRNRFAYAHLMNPNHPEYCPTVVTDSHSRKAARFNDLQNLVSGGYIVLSPEFSLGGEIRFDAHGSDVIVNALTCDGKPVVTVERVGQVLRATIDLSNFQWTAELPIPNWDVPVFYSLAWSDGDVMFMVDEDSVLAEQVYSYLQRDGVYYQIGGWGGGSFDLYRYYITNQHNHHIHAAWAKEYWQ